MLKDTYNDMDTFAVVGIEHVTWLVVTGQSPKPIIITCRPTHNEGVNGVALNKLTNQLCEITGAHRPSECQWSELFLPIEG